MLYALTRNRLKLSRQFATAIKIAHDRAMLTRGQITQGWAWV
jgi:hypothetical protein